MRISSFFCFGLGYTALTLVRVLQKQGWRVGGTCRSEEKRDRLISEGIEAYCFRCFEDMGLWRERLLDFRYVLYSIPPQAGEEDYSDYYTDFLPFLSTVVWFGYLSTTGVYGNTDGAWVDEGSVLCPGLTRQKRRVLAEERWLYLYREYGIPVHIFRLAGIYGPGRNALESVRAGTARRIEKVGHVLSRIHVEDIVTVLLTSFVKPNPGSLYNVCDDEPTAQRTVIEYASILLGQEAPRLVSFEDADLSPMAASFYWDNRRVCNRKIKEELGVILKYPDYRVGLEALMGSL